MQQSRYYHAASAPEEPTPFAGRPRARTADLAHGRTDQWHDPVTGLPRPRRFLEHLERVLAAPARGSRPVAMLVLEVAEFDVLEAQLGEPGCDELLRTIAERLHQEVPEPNLVTRLGRGAFAVVLCDLGEVAPEVVATHLLERASEPGTSGDRRLRWAMVGALALADDRAETAMELFDRAIRSLARAQLRSQLGAGASDAPRSDIPPEAGPRQ
ncbi:MAG TPA: GGDEF domain-containing protein [Geminicoccaceae bacterium]|nr:GGDEF domain-containing protein [Geminicoccaceae bacterium]